jgi:hypothetical protein
LDHRKRRALSVAAENRGSNTRPTAAAFVPWFLPLKIMAISNRARNAKNLANAQLSVHYPRKSTHSISRRPGISSPNWSAAKILRRFSETTFKIESKILKTFTN